MDTKKVREFKKVLEKSSLTDPIFQESKGDSSIENDSINFITDKLAILEKLFMLINSKISYNEMMTKILFECFQFIQAEAGSIFEFDYQSGEFFFRAVAGVRADQLLDIRIPENHGIVGFACQQKKCIIMSSLNPGVKSLEIVGELIDFKSKDILAVPIMIDGKMFGCIELLNPVNKERFDNQDIEFAEVISQYAAIVIKNRLILAMKSREETQNSVQWNKGKKAA